MCHVHCWLMSTPGILYILYVMFMTPASCWLISNPRDIYVMFMTPASCWLMSTPGINIYHVHDSSLLLAYVNPWINVLFMTTASCWLISTPEIYMSCSGLQPLVGLHQPQGNICHVHDSSLLLAYFNPGDIYVMFMTPASCWLLPISG